MEARAEVEQLDHHIAAFLEDRVALGDEVLGPGERFDRRRFLDI